MATRKTASKTSGKVSGNINLKINKKTTKKIKKGIKKIPIFVMIFALFFIAFGGVTGYFVTKLITKNDCFELVGQEEITLIVGEKYQDESVKVISFGKDLKDKVQIETNLKINSDGSYTSNEEGTFYIAYTVKSIKYGTLFKIQKVRLLNFVSASEGGE